MKNVKKIMFIDDDGIVNFVNKSLITKYFPNIESISYLWASDALKFFNTITNPDQKPDIIFLDINMPEIDGWEFIDELTNLGINLPIFVLTSSVDSKDFEKAKSYPQIKGYYSKPFQVDNFMKTFDSEFFKETAD